MGDMEKALAECRKAQVENREISDRCARVIASMYHAGQYSVSYSFASTGFISDGTDFEAIAADRNYLWRQMFDNYRIMSADGRLLADMMGTYLLARVLAGRVGVVSGWGGLWL